MPGRISKLIKCLIPSSLLSLEFFYLGDIEMQSNERQFKAESLEEFMQRGDHKLDWIIEKILPEEGVGIIAGLPEVGKSWLLLDLALEVARGGNWLNRFPARKGTVLYIDEESPDNGLRERLSLLQKAKDFNGNGAFKLINQKGVSLAEQNMPALRSLFDSIFPKLVIIDTLSSVNVGVEENSAAEMSMTFSRLRELSRNFGCLILVADHERKPNQFNSPAGHRIRGSNAKLAAVDIALAVSRKGNSMKFEVSKSKWASKIPPFYVELKDFNGGTQPVWTEQQADHVNFKPRVMNLRADFDEMAQKHVLTELAKGGWMPRLWLTANGQKIPVKRIDKSLKRLASQRLIERKKDGKQHHYRLRAGASDSVS
jgi:hypothetical protein